MSCGAKPIKPLKIIKVLEDKSYTNSDEDINTGRTVCLLVCDANKTNYIIRYALLYKLEFDSVEELDYGVTEVKADYLKFEGDITTLLSSQFYNCIDWSNSFSLYNRKLDGYAIDDFLTGDEYIEWKEFVRKTPMWNNLNMADLHIHTSNSDGSDSLWSLVYHLKEAGVTIFSVTDHDNVNFYKELENSTNRNDYRLLDGLKLIPGIEFSCRTEYGKCHILGYGIDINNDTITNTIKIASAMRDKKLINRIFFLKEKHNIILDEADKLLLMMEQSVGKPHIAKILVRKGYATNIGDAISKYLSDIPNDDDDKIDAKIAIDAIISAGGIPVWAHPLGGEGEKKLSEDELCNQMQCLLNKGIKGIEFYYSRYSAEDRKIIKNSMFKTNSTSKLLLSGGSDYHGKVKNIMLGELCSDDRCVLGNQLSVLTKLNYEDDRHETCTLEQTRYLCNKVVFALGKKVNSVLNDKDMHKANRNRYEFIDSVFKNSHLFCERKCSEANIEGKWYYSENGMVNVSLCEDKDYGVVTQTKVTRLTDKFINDIVSAFEEALGYRPKYETQNIMNVVQTITLTDE